MMNRTITLLAVALLLCSSGWWWLHAAANQLAATPVEQTSQQDDTTQIQSTQAQLTATATANTQQPAGTETEAALAATTRQRQLFEAMAWEYRRQRQQTPGNLQAWLEQLWQKCQEQSTEHCQQQLIGLAAFLSAAEMAELKALLLDYQHYQQQLGQLTLSTAISPQQRFVAIKDLREQIFGEKSEQLFGQEHQFAEYQFKLDEFQQLTAPGLSVEARLNKLNQLQQQSGIQAEGLIGPDHSYQQALRLIQDLPAQEKTEWQDKLRQQYFGADAAKVAAYELQQQKNQQQMLAYQQALQQLEQQFAALKPQLDAQSWQQQYAEALQQLRLTHFPH